MSGAGIATARGESIYCCPAMRFASEYVENVLNQNFEDAKRFFLAPLFSIHYAHLVMLAAQKIISSADAHTLRGALDAASRSNVQDVVYDGTYEDLFFYVERLIVQASGETVAGRLHTARSRNDIDMTMYRMRQRESLLGIIAASLDLRDALLELAERHRETVFAVHTHTQRAQPTTVAHYLLAGIEQLERDGARLRSAFERTNRCPLGACAITGTGFPIDRQLTADLLGFAGPTGNTYGSIATVDYLLEGVAATGVLLAGLGRIAQDLLLWSTAEFDYLRLGDGFVQCSSIMPQKRNPVALEHVRAIGSQALGRTQAIFTTVHNTPFGDIVDIEDDLQPFVFSTLLDATRAVSLLAATLRTAEFDAERLEARAADGWTTLTELADVLVRDHAVPFRRAHEIVARLVPPRSARSPERGSADRGAGDEAPRGLADRLAAASADVLGAPLRYSEAALADILSPRRFVEVRKTAGGPSPEETAEAATLSRAELEGDRAWWTNTVRTLVDAERRLAESAATL
jgi:argininosuccinate lyase